jgi:hypothetical protein
VLEEPTDRWYGMRELTAQGPSGYRLVFTSPVAEERGDAG